MTSLISAPKLYRNFEAKRSSANGRVHTYGELIRVILIDFMSTEEPSGDGVSGMYARAESNSFLDVSYDRKRSFQEAYI